MIIIKKRLSKFLINPFLLVGLFFSFLGTIFFLLGIGIGIHEHTYREHAEYTMATITRIDVYVRNGSSNEQHHSVYVEFKANGTAYQGRLNYYNSNMFEGGQVGIYYTPSNPQEFRADSNLFYLLFAGIGLLFVLIGCGIIFASRKFKLHIQPPSTPTNQQWIQQNTNPKTKTDHFDKDTWDQPPEKPPWEL